MFCDLGPNPATTVTAADLIPPSILDPVAYVRWHLDLIGKLTAVAHDRLFGAFCEEVVSTGLGTWGGEETWVAAKSVADGTQVIINPMAFGAHPLSTSVRVRMLSGPIPASSSQDYRIYHEPSGDVFASWNGGESTPTGYATHAWTNGDTIATISFTIAGGATYGISWNDGATVTEHDPTAQADPGVPAPVATTADLVGVAAEVDRIEAKCDFLIALVRTIVQLDPRLPAADIVDDPVDVVDADTPIDLVDAIGAVVTVTGVPDAVDVGFGVPQQFAKLGRVNFGTATAWYPSIPVTHSPLVIQPLPPGTTRMTVAVAPPAAATVQPLLRPK